MTLPDIIRRLEGVAPDLRVDTVEQGHRYIHLTVTAPQVALAQLLEVLTPGTRIHSEEGHRYTITLMSPGTAPRHRTGIRVPPALAATIRDHRDRTGEGVTTQLWDAFDRNYEALATERAERRALLGPTSGARRRRGIGATVQLWLTLDRAQLEQVTAAAGLTYNGNRSHLATELLRRYHTPVDGTGQDATRPRKPAGYQS